MVLALFLIVLHLDLHILVTSCLHDKHKRAWVACLHSCDLDKLNCSFLWEFAPLCWDGSWSMSEALRRALKEQTLLRCKRMENLCSTWTERGLGRRRQHPPTMKPNQRLSWPSTPWKTLRRLLQTLDGNWRCSQCCMLLAISQPCTRAHTSLSRSKVCVCVQVCVCISMLVCPWQTNITSPSPRDLLSPHVVWLGS